MSYKTYILQARIYSEYIEIDCAFFSFVVR